MKTVMVVALCAAVLAMVVKALKKAPALPSFGKAGPLRGSYGENSAIPYDVSDAYTHEAQFDPRMAVSS